MAVNDPQRVHATASRLAQLLAETQVTAAPHLSRLDAETRDRFLKAFLDDLEDHTAAQVGPLLRKLLDVAEWPEELRPLLEEAIEPPAAFSAFLEQIFLYGIVSQVIGAAVQPFLQGVTNDVSQAAVAESISRPLDPAVIATAAARGLELGAEPTVTMPAWAYTEAAMSGVSKEDIDLQASIVGTPPAPQELFELFRRGLITEDQIKTGLKEGDTRDDWVDLLTNLRVGWLTPLDFVRAAVQQQMTYADAKEWATKTGLDTSTGLPVQTGSTAATPDMFGLAYSIAGRPPGPQEAARMALRGIIDWEGTGADATTFQQAIAESDVKTKWTSALQQLAQYVPPPASVGSLYERGAITKDQAIKYWEMTGVPSELANGYAYIAEQQHVGQDKLLAKGEITTAYYDHLIDKATALEWLGLLGWTGQVADEILAIVDFRREIKAIDSVVKRIGGLYGGFKISATDAKTALTTVGIPDSQAQQLLTTWEALRTAPIRLPTTREIGLAAKAGAITQAEGLDELAKLGYQPRDAAIVLSAYMTAAVKPLPPAGTTVTG